MQDGRSTPRQRAARGRTSALVVMAAIAIGALGITSCGGDDLPSRQEFVDSLENQSEGLIGEDVASCMYDALAEDDAAAEAVSDWEQTDPVPAELVDLAQECLNVDPSSPLELDPPEIDLTTPDE